MLFLSLYTPSVPSAGPPSSEHMARMGQLTHGPFTDSVLMGASGFALLRADSREQAERFVKEFMEVAGDGECQILHVLEGPPPAPND